ncbi:MAG: GNAT family N-acetyltransferase [Tissierellia bacterium]|mgnify:FL=1|jgi:predicted GNAT family N-acyltransferase|nr:GNAT family N-acetyltransferase [Tissierellia bacterium]
MISTRWFQGNNNLSDVLSIRKEVYADTDTLSDFYDEFAFNAVLYVDDVPAGTARLLFKDGMYFIDMLCVKKQFKGLNYEDLLIRLLVRKAVTIGAEKTYIESDKDLQKILEKIGFIRISNDKTLMVKEGDVGGCCGSSSK